MGESQIKTLRNMNTVLMHVITCLVCRFKAPGGGFRTQPVLETQPKRLSIFSLYRSATQTEDGKPVVQPGNNWTWTGLVKIMTVREGPLNF